MYTHAFAFVKKILHADVQGYYPFTPHDILAQDFLEPAQTLCFKLFPSLPLLACGGLESFLGVATFLFPFAFPSGPPFFFSLLFARQGIALYDT